MPLSLNEAIENLYAIFARYGLHAPVRGCDCCVLPEDIARIQARPLRKLNAIDLEKYAHKALTTWGEVNDLKHFLPRLFELAGHQLLQGGRDFDEPILFSKLAYGEWHTWPEPEQRSLRDFMFALWQEALKEERNVDDILTAIGVTKTPLEPFLDEWLQSTSKFAVKNLISFGQDSLQYLTQQGSLKNYLWNDVPAQSQTLKHWLLAEPTLQHIEKYAIENTEDPVAEQALDLATYLRNTRE